MGRCPRHARCCRLDPGFVEATLARGHSKQWFGGFGQVLAYVESVIFVDQVLLVETWKRVLEEHLVETLSETRMKVLVWKRL